MTEQQRRFCEHYAANPNAAEAARAAGYSQRSARSQGQRLLTKGDIKEYIRQLQQHTEEKRIYTMQDVKRLWSDIMNDPTAKTSDRLKASELFAKAAGAFIHIRPGDENFAAFGESHGEDVVIYLPEMQKISDCEVSDDEELD